MIVRTIQSKCTAGYFWHRIKNYRRGPTPPTTICWSPSCPTEPQPRNPIFDPRDGLLGEEEMSTLGIPKDVIQGILTSRASLKPYVSRVSDTRLDSLLYSLGLGSRVDVGRMIERGRVSVNNKIVDTIILVNPLIDSFGVYGHALQCVTRTVVLMNKPIGTVCIRNDSLGRKSIYNLLEDPSLYIQSCDCLGMMVGGLILLSNNPRLISVVVDPSRKFPKTYMGTIREGKLDPSKVMLLERGLPLDPIKGNESVRKYRKVVYSSPCSIRVCHVTPPSKNGLTVIVTTWSTERSLVQRMFQTIGYRISDLTRISLGPYSMDTEKLHPGETRLLQPDEIVSLMSYDSRTHPK